MPPPQKGVMDRARNHVGWGNTRVGPPFWGDLESAIRISQLFCNSQEFASRNSQLTFRNLFAIRHPKVVRKSRFAVEIWYSQIIHNSFTIISNSQLTFRNSHCPAIANSQFVRNSQSFAIRNSFALCNLRWAIRAQYSIGTWCSKNGTHFAIHNLLSELQMQSRK